MRNKKGISYVKTAVLVLVIAMILSAVLAYASMMTIIQTAERNTIRVLDSFVIHNSKLIYESLKNGNDFTENINKSFYLYALSDELGLDFDGVSLYAINERGVLIYRMTNPNVACEWYNTLKLKATYEILIPVTFAGEHLFNLRIPQKVVSYYNLK